MNTEEQPIQPIAVDVEGLRAMLSSPNLSLTTIWRLEKTGRIVRVPGIRLRLYTVASVKAFVEGR